MTLLTVTIDGIEVARVAAGELPCEKTPAARIGAGSTIVFADASGGAHVHEFGPLQGWAHVSVRVHASLAVQADCVVTDAEAIDPATPPDRGIRFQPFLLPGAAGDPASLAGQGLFARGLHFSGTVTPGWIWLSGECDACRRTFLFQSIHTGFANVGYFYSGSSRYTLLVDDHVPGAPAALSAPDAVALAELEAKLPMGPDGSGFAHANPFRCPHCAAAYIDFSAHPGLREREYYANHLLDIAPVRYPAAD